MSGRLTKFFPEPERYEFRETAFHHFGLARRDFFKILGAGIAVFAVAKDAEALQESGRGRGFGGEELPKEITAWLHIGEDGRVTAFTGKVEIGQNIRTSLAQSVADELRVPFESVRMVMGDTALTPFDMGAPASPRSRRSARSARSTGRKGMERLFGSANLCQRKSHGPVVWPLRLLRGACPRKNACAKYPRRRSDHASSAMVGCRQSPSKSRRPGFRHRPASVHDRSPPRWPILWQGPSPAVFRRYAHFC